MSTSDRHWWDPHSEQPYALPEAQKPRAAAGNVNEYLRVFFTALGLAPAIAWRYLHHRRGALRPAADSFIGLSVSPGPGHGAAVTEMVEELGAQKLLIRVPSWDEREMENRARFAEGFRGRELLINILQNRDSVLDKKQWRRAVEQTFSAFAPAASHFQIGNAINRSKWGCRHSGDYLDLMEIAHREKEKFPGIRLLGTSVIDFEPLVILRTLVNRRRYRQHGCALQMYVDRRGAPEQRQFGVFNLHNKLRLAAALLALSNRSEKKLWVTETNWPLRGTEPYTPTSACPTVSEETQARYLTRYYQIAHRSGFVERVYWWQLINPGYGLVDHRGGALRKMPSYRAFKNLRASLRDGGAR